MDLFDPVNGYRNVEQRILKLTNINIDNSDEVSKAIITLESLAGDFDEFLKKYHEVILNEDEINTITGLYLKYLSILKMNEGIDFVKAREAMKVCLRLIPFFLGFVYDYHSFFCDQIEIPREVNDFIK